MKKVAVSIIVPIYNVEKFLARCLDSLINQTLKEIEIICVNDGSSDNSAQILQDYAQKDNRITIINQPHLGVSVARNKGMEIAQGEFLGFVDSDDWVDLDFYEKLYNSAKKNDCDICCGGIKKFHKLKIETLLAFSDEEITEDNAKKFRITNTPKCNYVWNKIYKTENLKKCNIKFPEGRYYEDVIFTPQVLCYLGKLSTVNTFYNYFRHQNSIVRMTSKNKKMQDDSLYAQKFLKQYLQKNCPEIFNEIKFEHKYKFLGLTFLKTIQQGAKKTYKLFNLIKIPFIT
jgi:glycosyltransferase involved in cell wall biosynthesis